MALRLRRFNLVADRFQPWRAVALAVAVAVVASGLGVVTAKVVSEGNDHTAESRFRAEATTVLGTIEPHVHAYALLVESGRALFASSTDVTRTEWNTFVEAQHATTAHPGIVAMVFIRAVPAAEIPAYESGLTTDPELALMGVAPFKVWPTGLGGDAYVVDYVFPWKGLESAFGNDQRFNQSRREALEAARDTGEITVTPPVSLVVDGTPGGAVLFYGAVYDNTASPTDVLGRRAALQGFVALVVDLPRAMETLLQRLPATLDVHIRDLGPGGHDPPALFFDRFHAPSDQDREHKFDRTFSPHLAVADRTWAVEFASDATYLSWLESASPAGAIGIYFALAVALAATTYYWGSRESRARMLARAMTGQLQQSKDNLDEAQELGKMGSWEAVPGTGVTAWSRGLYRMLGVDPRSFKPTRGSFLEFVHPEDRPAVEAAMRRNGDDPVPFTAEARIITRDGEVRPVRVEARVRKGDRGAPVRMVGVVQDITAQRGAQEALGAAFEQKVKVDKLEAAQAERARLLNVMAHELNTPLTPLQLQTHLLKVRAVGELNPAQAKAVDMLDRNVHRLATLVEDIRDVGRLQAGAMTFHPVRFDLRTVIDDVVELQRPLAAKAHVQIVVDAHPDLFVEADPDRTVQVLNNLLSNAIKYSPNDARIDVRGRLEAREVRVSVTDHGPGLTPDQKARLFLPFSQVQEGKAQKPGTGLGLFICDSIARSQGGRMECASQGAGTGATFTLRLPFNEPTQPTVGAPMPAPAPPAA